MTDVEVKSLVRRSQHSQSDMRRLAARRSALLAVAVLALVPFLHWVAFAIALIFGARAFAFHVSSRVEMKGETQMHAATCWEFAVEHDARFRRHFPEFNSLKARIARIYALDPRGDSLPISYALRLSDTFLRYHDRLTRLHVYARQLRDQRAQLSHKMARLQSLGEDSAMGRARLDDLSRDIEVLEVGLQNIQASCARLEAIVDSVTQSLEDRQLRRDIERLSQPSSSITPAFPEDELEDIERQITREIETFLALERETDAHLREL